MKSERPPPKTLGTILDEIAKVPDVRRAGIVADRLRNEGMNYYQIRDLFAKHGISNDEYEALMYEADGTIPY
tara:strand:- start:240 stop:455 length:216 start_codon:yes stop_codon:yes gene_type:complete